MKTNKLNYMYKQPLQYRKEDLDELMFKPLKIFVGLANKKEVIEVLEGQIVKCGLAANPPHLPADFEFQLDNGQKRKFNFFEVKRFENQ